MTVKDGFQLFKGNVATFEHPHLIDTINQGFYLLVVQRVFKCAFFNLNILGGFSYRFGVRGNRVFTILHHDKRTKVPLVIPRFEKLSVLFIDYNLIDNREVGE